MYLGIDIGGTKCALVLGRKDGTIVEKIKFATEDVQTTLEKILQTAEELAKKSPEKVESVGVSCGGPLDSRTGVILSPPNLPGWDHIEINRLLRERLGIPAYLCNDANACALAEWKYGAGVGTENMLFLTFGTGMGAGLVLNGRLYSGASDMAGEIGHVRMADHGPVGYGKAGSFEGFCSGGGLAQIGKTIAMERFQQGKSCSYCESLVHMDEITARSIAMAAREGHEDAIHVYDICAEKLGAGLAILVDVLNPERIVLGSIYMRDSALLCDRMQAVLRRECLPLSYKAVEVVPAMLEENIGDIAALTVAAEGHTWTL